MNRSRAALRLLLICCAIWQAADSAFPADLDQLLRRPIALAPSPDGQWLYVANRDSGSLSILDLTSRHVAAELKIGRRLADIAIVRNSAHLLAADEAAHELLLIGVIGKEAT